MGLLTVVAIGSGLISAICFRVYCDRDPVLSALSHLSYIGHAWYYLSHRGCFRPLLGAHVIVQTSSILIAIDERSWDIFSGTPGTNDPLTKAFWKAKLSCVAFQDILSAFAIASMARSDHESN